MQILKAMGLMLPVLGLVTNAHSAILDQDGWISSDQTSATQATLGPGSNNITVAQTFTAGVSEWLDSVHLQAVRAPGNIPTSPLVIGIYGVNAGGAADINQPLGPSVSIAPSLVPPSQQVETGTVVVDFRSATFQMTAGQKYAIVLSAPATVDGNPTSGSYLWGASQQDEYSDGVAYFINPSIGGNFVTYTSLGGSIRDLSFQTFYTTDIPEPASLAALSLTGMALLRRRKRAE